MAAGPLFPNSAYPTTTGKLFPKFHVGAGDGAKHDEGLGVMASLDADAYWGLRFQLPPILPAGTLKLRLVALGTNATGGSLVAKVNPKWASIAMGESPSDATLYAEGTSTVTWAASSADNDKYKETKIALDADTAVGGQIIVMALFFETSGWTLSTVSTWIASLIWE